MKNTLKRTSWAAIVGMATAAVFAAIALAAAPSNTTPPAISGEARVGATLTVSNGTWTGSPVEYQYQWQRCSGSTCSNIAGSTQRTYVVTSADAGRSLRAVVTAINADGLSTANSAQTAVVPAVTGAPVNTSAPTIVGDEWVGATLRAEQGTWSGNPTGYAYQWLRCDGNGADCFAIVGARGSTYGVRFADVYSTLRVEVRAQNANGVTTARSAATGIILPFEPVVVTGNKAPTLRFLSLKRLGNRVYARFRVCDDSGRISVIERDSKPRTLGYVRRFAVTTRTCVTATRSWTPAPRFRTAGRFFVTLRAVDKSGRSSRFVTRSLVWR